MLFKGRFLDALKADYLYKALLKSSSAKVLTFILGYIFQVVLARMLSIEGYGYYSYIMNLILLTGTICIFGFNSSSKRFVGGYWSLKKFNFVWGFLVVAILAITGLSVFIGAIDYIYLEYQNKRELSLVVIVSLVLLTSYNNFFSHLLFALKRPFAGAFSMNGSRYFISLIFIGVLTLFIGAKLDVEITLKIVLVSIIMTICYQMYHLFQSVKFEMPRYASMVWLKTSAGLLMVGAFAAIQNKIDVQILGMMRSSAEVGLYNAVYRTTEITQFFFKAAAGVSMPIIAEMFMKNDHRTDIQTRLNKIIKLTFWPTIFLIMILGLGSKYFLLVFGKDFMEGWDILLVLLIGQFSIAIMGASSMVLNMSGNHKYTSMVYASASGLNVILNLWLIPEYGAVGAAISTSIVNILSSVTFNMVVRKKLNLNTSILNLYFNAKKS